MKNRKEEISFEHILVGLKRFLLEVEPALHDPTRVAMHSWAVAAKRQTETAIDVLEFCQRHQLDRERLKGAIVLPETRTYGAEYRIMNDEDSGARDDWNDPMIDGKSQPLYAAPGSILI